MHDELALVRELLAQRAAPDAPLTERRTQMDAVGEAAPLPDAWRITPVDLGRPAERHDGLHTRADRALLYLHGGGYCLGSPRSHRGLAAQLANAAGVTAFVLDYRLAPEHPYPAGLDDACAAFDALTAMGFSPSQIAVAGDSAGGGLALALAVKRLAAGKAGPVGQLLISPWLDLACEGASFSSKSVVDPMLSKGALDVFANMYLGAMSKREVLASPLYGDFRGLSPTLVQVGTDEVLLSDSQTFADRAKAAGMEFALEIWPRMIHVFPAFYPLLTAARDAITSAGGWLVRRFDRAAMTA